MKVQLPRPCVTGKQSWRGVCLVPALFLSSWLVLQLLLQLIVASKYFVKPNRYTSRRGFVTGTFCHPFALPKVKTRLSFVSTSENKLTDMGPGFCLCADDEQKTTIAGLKGCGSKPLTCEKACAEHITVGAKASPCIQSTHTACSDWSFYKNMEMPSDDIIELVRELHLTIGPHLGVKLPRGSRRHIYKDFAMYDRRMSKADVAKVRRRIDQFKDDAPTLPEKRIFQGRGIVIVGGNSPKFAASLWITVHAIRRTGSKLPIQIWYPEGELPDCGQVSELGRLNVTVSYFPHLNRADIGFLEVTNRFMFKIIALAFSPYDEVLLLDSDNIILRDPQELFSSPSFFIYWIDVVVGFLGPFKCTRLSGNFRQQHGYISYARKWASDDKKI